MSSHAASRPRTPPAPPSQPARAPRTAPRPQRARAPRTERWRAPLRRALLCVLGLLVVGGVAAVGWAISSTTDAPEPAATWRSIALGPATVTVPARWQREAASAPGLMELPEPAAAFATAPGLQAHAVVVIVGAGSSPPARVTLARLLGPLGASRPSRVADRPARTYAARPVAGDRVAEATLARTAAGTLLVLCVARSASWSGAAGCAGDLRPPVRVGAGAT